MSSYFLSHTACPKCGSSDAYAEYSDGHFYCFSCRYYKPAKIVSAKQVENALFQNVKQNIYDLPIDISKNIPIDPYKWLKQYGITTKEIEDNSLSWSGSREMLIFPFFGETKDDVLFWQGRYFPARTPKVFTSGFPDKHLSIHSNENDSSSVVVVEDSISAIKVSRVLNSSELLGSNLSKHKAMALSRQFDNLYIWLDSNKFQASIKFSQMYKPLFKQVVVVYSEKDPKEYSTQDIGAFLNVK